VVEWNVVSGYSGTIGQGASGYSGPSSDMFSALVNAEISITGATTATIGRMHVCSGTSSNYTVTLPPVLGNAGKFIGFRMDAGLTKLVTLDGTASETIDGSLTRVMWASEAAILFCDGATYTKVAGKTIPLICKMHYNITNPEMITNATDFKVNLNTMIIDNQGTQADTSGGKINIIRPGLYSVTYSDYFFNGSIDQLVQMRLKINGTSYYTNLPGIYSYALNNASNIVGHDISTFSLNDYLEMSVYKNATGDLYLYGASSMSPLHILMTSEIPTW
jgi:hypothetical protein